MRGMGGVRVRGEYRVMKQKKKGKRTLSFTSRKRFIFMCDYEAKKKKTLCYSLLAWACARAVQ
jgi:hypothetical protein